MSRLFDTNTDEFLQGTDDLPATGTLSLWWYPSFAQGDGAIHFAYYSHLNGSNTFTLNKDQFANLICGWITGGVNHRIFVATANYTLNQNAWNSIIFTWDDTANTEKFYLNGTEIGSKSTLSTWTGTIVKRIGNDNVGDKSADGRLAEITVFDRVLNAPERTYLDNGGLPRRLLPIDHLQLRGDDDLEPNSISGREDATNFGTVKADHAPIAFGASTWNYIPSFDIPISGEIIPLIADVQWFDRTDRSTPKKVEAALSADGFSPTIEMQPGRTFEVSVSGTFTGTIRLQRTFERDGILFVNYISFDGPFEETTYLGEDKVIWRIGFGLGDFGSGTANVRISQ